MPGLENGREGLAGAGGSGPTWDYAAEMDAMMKARLDQIEGIYGKLSDKAAAIEAEVSSRYEPLVSLAQEMAAGTGSPIPLDPAVKRRLESALAAIEAEPL